MNMRNLLTVFSIGLRRGLPALLLGEVLIPYVQPAGQAVTDLFFRPNVLKARWADKKFISGYLNAEPGGLGAQASVVCHSRHDWPATLPGCPTDSAGPAAPRA